MEPKKVLLIEDEIPTLENLKLLLEMDEFVVDTATDLKTALQKVRKHHYPLIILDLRLPDGNGIEILHKVNPKTTKVIVLTAHGDIKTAVSAVKNGAYDFLQKPLNYRDLKRVLLSALESLQNNTFSQQEVLSQLIGNSEAVKKLREILPELAKDDKPLLLRGERGVGKTFVGKLIHQLSPRRDYPIIEVPLGGKGEFELERELFGSSIPGKEQKGAFERAQRGTVILTGLEKLPINLQKKLLRVLREETYTPLGENVPKRLTARVIATTSINLFELADKGKFHEGLVMFLGDNSIEIPPLRERREDIRPLFDYFLEKFSKEEGVEKPKVSEEVYEFFNEYEFPGNVKELRNMAERVVFLHPGKLIKVSDLNITPQNKEDGIYDICNWKEAKKRFEKEFLKRKLLETGGDVKKVAKLINLDISNIYRKIKEYNLGDFLKK